MSTTKNIMIIYGTEAYLMEEGRKKFFAAARKRSGGDAEVQTFQKDAAAATVVESFQGTSLFSSGTITVWYDCPFLPLKKGGRSRSKISKEEQWFLDEAGHLDDGNSLLFYSKGNVDTGSAFFKALKPMAEVVAAEAVTEKTVMPYVTAYLKDRGRSLSRDGVVFLQDLFQTWGSISLLYVFSELDKLCITLPDGKKSIGPDDLADLFAGTMEKNLFTFMDAFLRRNGEKTLPFVEGLFSKQDAFLKNTGYMLSRLRLLLSYKELLRAHAGQHQCEQVLTAVNKGRSAKYVIYHLQKVASYWTIEELERCICNIFTLQLHIRSGKASPADMGALICLYCSLKR